MIAVRYLGAREAVIPINFRVTSVIFRRGSEAEVISYLS